MAEGPNPAGKSHASHKLPNGFRPSVKSTPKVLAKPNTVSQKGPKSGTARSVPAKRSARA